MNNPPLWMVLQHATLDLNATVRECYAAEIRAFRDWLVPEEPEFEDDGSYDAQDLVEQLAQWEGRRVIRARLTAEADRAEQGE